MPISTDHVGRVYPPTAPREVTADGVAEFATVLGLPVDQVPPTYPIIVANDAWQALFADPELELELQRIVHGEQKFTWNRPVRIGDRLVGATTIDRIVERGGTEMIHATVALTTEDGEDVGTASATLIHTREGTA
ncbi:MAG TPA: MaoC family dehydratase N-terminal domain-containing protein [Candidatus Avipropionibacterium avicola]|uniref:MaoC family dehydratase N-terminal domain-containing protein n=1 Tax=Candidatus Avipropionibacterium avicola TaxID=2840701 RepID=A0A9D1GVY6_9ACTN|nr:MaoC family dehydratase N-terminal domain-containing protein [Candidatus Avipropionibacterium avicola]